MHNKPILSDQKRTGTPTTLKDDAPRLRRTIESAASRDLVVAQRAWRRKSALLDKGIRQASYRTVE